MSKSAAKAKEKRRLLKLNEQALKDSKSQYDIGIGFMEKNNFVKAIAAFNSAIEINPENVEAYVSRGRAHKEQKEYEKAIADFTKAVDSDPQNFDAFAGRGNCYECLGDLINAVNDYNTVIDLSPDDDHALNMRGNAHQAMRIAGLKLKNADFASVVHDFTRALEINPYNFFAFCNRGNAYHDRKEFKSAIEDYTNAITVKVDYVYAYTRRGAAYLDCVVYAEKKMAETDELDSEVENKNSLLGKSPEELKILWEKQFKEQQKEEQKKAERLRFLQNAVADFTTVLTFDENDKEAYAYRAKAFDLLGETEKAKADRAKMAEADAKSKDRH